MALSVIQETAELRSGWKGIIFLFWTVVFSRKNLLGYFVIYADSLVLSVQILEGDGVIMKNVMFI